VERLELGLHCWGANAPVVGVGRGVCRQPATHTHDGALDLWWDPIHKRSWRPRQVEQTFGAGGHRGALRAGRGRQDPTGSGSAHDLAAHDH
jgi:hypothetical protein